VSAPAAAPAAPSALTATVQPGPAVSLTWRDNATNESGFEVERSSDNGATFSRVGIAPARTSTGNVTFVDTTPAGSTSYVYRVRAVNVTGASAWSNTSATVSIGALAPAPAIRSAVATRQGRNEQVTVSWSNVTGETGYRIQWSATSDFSTIAGSGTTGVDVLTFRTGNIARQVWYFRVGAVNAVGTSWSAPTLVPGA
jgi:predicted phage tail protein